MFCATGGAAPGEAIDKQKLSGCTFHVSIEWPATARDQVLAVARDRASSVGSKLDIVDVLPPGDRAHRWAQEEAKPGRTIGWLVYICTGCDVPSGDVDILSTAVGLPYGPLGRLAQVRFTFGKFASKTSFGYSPRAQQRKVL